MFTLAKFISSLAYESQPISPQIKDLYIPFICIFLLNFQKDFQWS